MKKAPHKLPFEIHDPKPEVPICVDLSDQTLGQPQSVLSQPQEPAAEL